MKDLILIVICGACLAYGIICYKNGEMPENEPESAIMGKLNVIDSLIVELAIINNRQIAKSDSILQLVCDDLKVAGEDW